MKRTRQSHGATFKTQVVLAAGKGDKTLAELTQQFRVHPTGSWNVTSPTLSASGPMCPTCLKAGPAERSALCPPLSDHLCPFAPRGPVCGRTVKQFAIVTNRAGDGLTLIRWHWEKARTVEHTPHVLKNEWATAALPSGKFGANAGRFRPNSLTYNLLSALKRLALPGELSEVRPKRLRVLVFNTIGTVIHHARHTLLRLTMVAQQALLSLARSNILALDLA